MRKKEKVARLKKELREHQAHVKMVSDVSRNMIFVFRIVIIAVIFVLFTYLFEELNAYFLTYVVVFCLLAMIFATYAILLTRKRIKLHFRLRGINRMLMFTVIFFLIFLLINPFWLRLIFLYIALIFLAISVQEIVFFEVFKRNKVYHLIVR
jgi:hypothetical protein